MAGPIIYYRDYIDFINGTNFYKWDDKNVSAYFVPLRLSDNNFFIRFRQSIN